MQKRKLLTILGVMLAVVVASLSLVFAVGPRVGADSEVVLNQESHFNITINGDVHKLTGISDAGKSLINGKKFRVVIPSSVTSIGNFAFGGCSGLTSIKIPSSVTSIGYHAFEGCSGLTSIEIPSSVTSIGGHAFWLCSGLTTVTFAGNSQLTSIGNNAFYECYGLTSIEIPSSVTSIGGGAFYECSGLTTITVDEANPNYYSNGGNCIVERSTNTLIVGCKKTVIPSSVTSIGELAFYGCSGLTTVTFAENSQLTSIGNSAFWGCNSLTSIEIPSSVTSIGESAFAYCSGLTTVTFAGNSQLTRIGGYAFSECRNLTSIEIPSGVTSIGYATFSGCSGLTNIEIPSSVTSIGGQAFYCCSGLTSIEIPSSVTSIDGLAFSHCSGLTSIEIPSGVTSIGGNAFDYCSSLTSIEIPSSVTSIGVCAFAECSGLTTVTFAENSQLTSISDSAFSCCSGLTSIEIPSGVTRIGYGAFYGCSCLTSIEIPSTVTSIGKDVFDYCSGLTKIIVRNPALMNNSNLTKYANKLHYGADQNTVEFVTNCATTVDNRTVDFGATTTEPTLQKEHYHLVGWYCDEAFTQPFTFDTPIKYNMPLYAKWEINHYTVTFWTYGGDTVAPQTVDYGSRANPQLAVTTKPGYRFLYWVADGETTPYEFGEVTSDVSLAAKWMQVHTVTFDNYDSQTVDHETKVTEPAAPTREGYIFKGWLLNGADYDFDTPVMDDITLTAQWEAIPVEPENNEVQDTAENNALWLWIAGGVAAVFGGVGIVAGVVVAKKRKK